VRSSSPASRLTWSTRLAALGAALLLAAPAAAEAVRVSLVVSHASSQQGPMEQPNLLPPGFNFQSHRVLQSTTLDLAMGQTGTHRLPNGKTVKLRPTAQPCSARSENDLMLHVEVEGGMTSDLCMRNGKRVTIRHPEPYQGGNLLVHLEAFF
jgi:hypothetical protein